MSLDPPWAPNCGQANGLAGLAPRTSQSAEEAGGFLASWEGGGLLYTVLRAVKLRECSLTALMIAPQVGEPPPPVPGRSGAPGAEVSWRPGPETESEEHRGAQLQPAGGLLQPAGGRGPGSGGGRGLQTHHGPPAQPAPVPHPPPLQGGGVPPDQATGIKETITILSYNIIKLLPSP